MSTDPQVFRRRLTLLAATSCWAAAAAPLHAGRPFEPGELPVFSDVPQAQLLAQASPGESARPVAETPPPLTRATPSQSVTVNLINRLVARGLLPKEEAADLIKQAEEEAVTARAQAAEPPARSEEKPPQLTPPPPPPPLPEPPLFPDAVVPPPDPVPTDDVVRVTYIPEVVKAQMRDEIKAELLKQAREENWAGPEKLPSWVPRFRVSGDVRVRYEGLYYPAGNDASGAFPNFNAINTGSPFDVSGTVFSPQYNVDQDRQRVRLRARLGAEIDLSEGFTAGLRIATGENNSPVTTNQSFGLANQAQGGNFSKYAIWLDRAFLKYEIGSVPATNLALTVPPAAPQGKGIVAKNGPAPIPHYLPTWGLSVAVGRFDNPFFSASTVWDDDLGFDGIALQAKYQVTRTLKPFVALGAFPVFNTDLNFSSNQPVKFKSYDKWLYGAQLGTDWVISKDFTAKFGVAYYYFQNIEGKLSDPYTPLNAQDASNTDNSRPSFAQKGNTYMAIRNIIPDASNNFGTTNQYQYFGLATPFRNLVATGRVNYNRWEPVQLSLLGEYTRNLAFDGGDINQIAVNNRGPTPAGGGLGAFDGGDTAWMVDLRFGHPALEKRWDWAVTVGYRYLESDAVVDGFTDSDFGNGGTNLQGYTIGGTLALGQRVWLGLRWMSADQIAGPPLKNDILQFDVNGKF